MRELNNSEVAAVSGAGIFANIGQAIGSALGGVVDLGTGWGGLETNAATAVGKLGSSIGSLLEFNIQGAISDFGSGIMGIINFGIDAISQLRK